MIGFLTWYQTIDLHLYLCLYKARQSAVPVTNHPEGFSITFTTVWLCCVFCKGSISPEKQEATDCCFLSPCLSSQCLHSRQCLRLYIIGITSQTMYSPMIPWARYYVRPVSTVINSDGLFLYPADTNTLHTYCRNRKLLALYHRRNWGRFKYSLAHC